MMLVPWLLLGGFLLATATSFWYLQLDLAALVSTDGGHKMLQYAAGFFPPELAPAFLARMSHAGLETLAISAIGTLLAAVAGLALGLPASGRLV